MKKNRLAFIDLETTGLDPARHEIIEIGLLLAKPIERSSGPDYETIDEWETKVKPVHLETAEPEALRINGYNESDWLFAVELRQALQVLAKKTDGAVMIAQNVSFDWAFLQQGFGVTGVKNLMHYHRLDLISIAFAHLWKDPRAERFNLQSLAAHFGLKNEKAHTALADIRITYQVFRRLLSLPEERPRGETLTSRPASLF